jgi:eukaryotic-like serine/threonine-protein kinase
VTQGQRFSAFKTAHEWLADDTLDHLRDVADWPDLGDRYRITGRLGRGGMSTVFAARDERLDREVAIKVLDATDAGATALRLAREAHILARLEHPGIVPVHDAGRLPDGRIFYAMKLVRGHRLDTLRSEGPADPSRAAESLADPLSIVARVCDALSFAHAQGVVHGDLKPENIMVGPFGEVLVMDWGVAAVVTGASEGLIAGTPGFMAPEQARGAAVDRRADVYGLGALLLAVVPPPLPRPLAAIAARAMATDPAARYQSAAAFATDLTRYRHGDRVEAYRESLWERGRRLVSRYRVPIGLVLAYMLMRVALILWFGR